MFLALSLLWGQHATTKRAPSIWLAQRFVSCCSKPGLSDLISEPSALAKYPPSSLARALAHFLAADELDYAKFCRNTRQPGCRLRSGLFELYNNRERDLHDLIHVLFGYERTRWW